jgi:hypothetical protein
MIFCAKKRSCLLLASSRTKRIYIYRALFLVFLALVAFAGGLTYFSSSRNFRKPLPISYKCSIIEQSLCQNFFISEH